MEAGIGGGTGGGGEAEAGAGGGAGAAGRVRVIPSMGHESDAGPRRRETWDDSSDDGDYR